MERKNTVLLTVIAVATLLVAVVGATFAYFTATATEGSNEDVTEVETAKVSNVTLAVAPEETTNFDPVYPGVWLATGATVSASYGEGGEPTTSYKVGYTLNFEVDLSAFKNASSTSTFTYSIYKVDGEEVASPVTSCVDREVNDGGVFKMYVDSCAVDNKLGSALVTDGTIDYSNSGDGKVALSLEEQSLNVGSETHYYLVVKYANDTSNPQSNDPGLAVKMQFTGTSDSKIEKADA